MAQEIAFKIKVTDIQSLGKLEAELKKISKDKAALNKLAKTEQGLNQQQQQQLGDLIIKQGKLNDQKRQLTKNIKNANIVREQQVENLTKINAQLALEQERLKKLEFGTKEYKKQAKVVEGLTDKIRKHNKAIGRATTFVGEYAKGFQQAFLKAGAIIGGAVLLWGKLSRTVGSVVSVIRDYESAITDVKVITGATGEEFEKLNEFALFLGRTTTFTATEMAQFELELSKLGFKTNEILQAGSITKLAQAFREDLGQSAKVTAATLKGFGLEASETERVVNVMATSFSNSALDLSKFETAMATVAPAAKNAGETIETTTAKLGLLVDRGLDASTAGTSLRNIFLEMAKQGLTFEEAMTKINTATDKNAVALELFGKRGAIAATILAENSTEAGILEGKLTDIQVTAEEMANEQLTTLEGKTKLLTSAYEGFILEIDEGNSIISKFIKSGLDGLTGAFTLLTEYLSEETIPTTQKFLGGLQYTETVKAADKFTEQLIEQGRAAEYLQQLVEDRNVAEVAFFQASILRVQMKKEAEIQAAKELEETPGARSTPEQIEEEGLMMAEKEQEKLDLLFDIDQEGRQRELDAGIDFLEKEVEANAKAQKAITDNEIINNKIRLEDEKKTLQARQGLTDARIDLAGSALNAIGQIAGKESAIYKASFILQKGLALAEVVINTQRELALINANPAVNADITQTLRTTLITAAVARALGIVATIKGANFDSGGVIQSGNEINGFPKNGDNTLILAKPGEVVLNERQQLALGGSDTFRRIGVPGFQNGGAVPASTSTATRQVAIAQQNAVTLEDVVDLINVQRVVQVESDYREISNRVINIESENEF